MSTADYLNSTVWARLAPSSIHGVGVFAIRDIPKGQAITDFHYPDFRPIEEYELTRKEFDRIRPEIRALILDRILYTADEKTFLVTSPNDHAYLQLFMNHSDNPNVVECKAIRHIRAGEEILESFHDVWSNNPHPVTIAHHSFLDDKNRSTERS